MPEMSQKTWLLVVATLALAVAYLGYQLSDRNATIGLLNSDNAGLTLEKDQLILDLEKMRFSYDTLETENTMMLAELAAQQERIDGLLTKVKNGYWEVAKLKKEAEIRKQQETLNKVAEQHVAQRRPRGPVQRPQQRRGIPRRVIPRPEPMRGLLHPEEVTRPAGFMGLLFDGVKK